ncbi:MAG: FAD/NAD(P)-binding protein [Actinobacteria bacterium]|nr:FAD/NAD(P)-binding protein [Actinomycetota bacterium]
MGTLADLRSIPVDPLEPIPYRVVELVQETVDVITVVAAPVGQALPPAQPGQFMLVWAFGVGEIPISVSRMAADGRVMLTVRAVGQVSGAIVGLQVGEVVGLRGPFGTVWPVAEVLGADVVVVAGGLGLAPLRMAIDALVQPDPRRITVVVGSREPAQRLYPGDLTGWAEQGASVHETVDTADREWHGGVGTATTMVERLHHPHQAAFVCGPELMMMSAVRALAQQGVPTDRTWVSLERNMHCGIGHCGRCQLGALLLCRDGAVVRWDHVEELMEVRGR